MKKRTRLLGYIGVDSGALMISDPCNADKVAEAALNRYQEQPTDTTEDFPGGLTISTSPETLGQMGVLGVAFTPGGRMPGDGEYAVLADYEDGILMQVRIIADRENTNYLIDEV